jgi:hypothetical protein
MTLLGGCSLAPRYRAVTTIPHKDVVQMVVYLSGKAAPEEYQRIAIEEVARIRAREANREYPLYEVKFEFRREGPTAEKLALVTVYLQEEKRVRPEIARAIPPRIETILY